MFLTGVMLSIGTFLLNMILFAMQKFGSDISPVVIIVICAVVVGVIGVPLFVFFIFHLVLICKGKTTR